MWLCLYLCRNLWKETLESRSPCSPGEGKVATVGQGSHQKNISHVQGQRRSPKKTVGGAKLTLESNPIPTRDAQRAQTKPCVHQDPGIPQDTEPDLPLSVLVSLAESRAGVTCYGDRDSGCSRPGRCGTWHKSSWRRLPLAPPQSRQADDPQTGELLYQEVLALLQKF